MGKGFVIVVLPSYSVGILKIFDGVQFTARWNDVQIFASLDAARRKALWLSRIHPVDIMRINVALGDHVDTVRMRGGA